MTVPVVVAVWYLRLAWYGGTTGVLTEGRAVLAVSGPPYDRDRPQRVRGLAALVVAALLLSTTVVAVVVGVYAVATLVSAALAERLLTGMVLGSALVLSGGGLYCVTRWAFPAGRLDRLAASLTPSRGWQLKALAGTGAFAEEEEIRLLDTLLTCAASQNVPVVAGVAQTRNRSLLEDGQRLRRVTVPGASRWWPPLLVAGAVPPPAPDTPTVRRRWPVWVGFGLVVSGLAALVAVVAVYVVLPAEQAVPECRAADAPSSCISSRGEALYWAVTTVTTTGYGDFYPRSTTGRWAAAGLMLGGVVVVAGLLTSLAVTTVTDSVRREHQLIDVLRSQTTTDPSALEAPRETEADDADLRGRRQQAETPPAAVVDRDRDGDQRLASGRSRSVWWRAGVTLAGAVAAAAWVRARSR